MIKIFDLTRAGAAIACLLLPATPVDAAPEYLRYYKSGLTAAESRDWQHVDKLMREAIERQPESKRRRLLRRSGYYPHFYLGLARYHLRDCSGALAAWAESENQGAIVGREEYAELLRLQADCQKNGSPTATARSTAAPSSTGTEKTGKDRVRTGQKWVEKGAAPTQNTLNSLGSVAPQGSGLDKVVSEGQQVVNLAETATNLVDAVLPPSQGLTAAIDAYFAGEPRRTLQVLQAVDLSDPRARAQVYLFRAAASFRLHLSDGDETLLATARENAAKFRKEQWRDDFPAELFDPRFVRLVRGGG